MLQKYGVRSLPTYIYKVKGEEVRRSSGRTLSASELKWMWRQSWL